MRLSKHKYLDDGAFITAHNAMASLLRCEPGDAYALHPFAPVIVDDKWWIAASVDPHEDDGVLLIDGKTGAMRFHEDAAATGFWGESSGPVELLHLYTNGIIFARAWAASRRDALETCRRAKSDVSADLSRCPGLAAVGDVARFGNFADLACAETIEIDNPRLRHVLADAMLRAARMPVVVAAPTPLKMVASRG